MIEVTVKQTLDDEFVSDVLVTAFDGSVGACWYWAKPDGVAWRETDFLDGDCWISCAITEDDEDGGSYDVNAEVIREGIQEGIQKILDGSHVASYIKQYVRSAVGEKDSGDIDAEAADCIVQVGLFGELVYG